MGCGESKIKRISLTSDQDWGVPAPANVWGLQDGEHKVQDRCPGVHNSGQGFQAGRVPTPHIGGEGGGDSAGRVDTEQCAVWVSTIALCVTSSMSRLVEGASGKASGGAPAAEGGQGCR